MCKELLLKISNFCVTCWEPLRGEAPEKSKDEGEDPWWVTQGPMFLASSLPQPGMEDLEALNTTLQ